MTDLEKWREFEKNNPPKPNRYAKEEERKRREERIRRWDEEKIEKRRKREDTEMYYGKIYTVKDGTCEYCSNIHAIEWRDNDWRWRLSDMGLARYPDNGECVLLHHGENDYEEWLEAVLKVNFCPVCGRKL